jgi:hypothetical protein
MSENYKTDLKLHEGEELKDEIEEWSWNYDEQNSDEVSATSEETKTNNTLSIEEMLTASPSLH